MIIKGKAHVLGSNIDTDAIIPARFLTTFNPDELGEHCFSDLIPTILKKPSPGDVIVAGDNFGCGSSREHAPLAIKGAGYAAVVASSFARIFLRNAINVGLRVFEVPGIDTQVKEGDWINIDTHTGEIRNETTGMSFKAKPIPPFLKEIIDSGGLVEYAKRKAGKR